MQRQYRGVQSPAKPAWDFCAVIPILACAYSVIIFPLLSYNSGAISLNTSETTLSNRLYWPALFLITLFAVRSRFPRLLRIEYPHHIIWLLMYAGFAGLSVLWALKPGISLTRYVQQLMILATILLPALLANRADLMQGLFRCFAIAAVLNLCILPSNEAIYVEMSGGYLGYFLSKNYLGMFAGITGILAFHEIAQRGTRRAEGILVLIVAVPLLYFSNSKTAFAAVPLALILAGIALLVWKTSRASPALVLAVLPITFFFMSSFSTFSFERLGYIFYGDPTFTGRTVIWGFLKSEIAARPILGWGYQSFWLVGPDAPSVANAPGWVKAMPNGHNGYYDTMVELGYVGLFLLVAFIFSTIHATGQVAKRDLSRAYCALALIVYILIYNFLESLWMRGAEMPWLVFVILAGEIARFYQPLHSAQADIRPRVRTPDRMIAHTRRS